MIPWMVPKRKKERKRIVRVIMEKEAEVGVESVLIVS